LAKEIVAFANAKGGTILIGVTDDGVIKQKALGNGEKSKAQTIARECDPSIDIKVESVDNEPNVLAVRVKEGLNKPYRCSGGFYMREGASSNKRKTSEIYGMFRDAGRFSFDDILVPKAKFSEHFKPMLLKKFLAKSEIEQVLSDEDTVTNLGAAEHIDGEYIFNNTGILFFTNAVDPFCRHAIIQCARYDGNIKVDIADQQDLHKDLMSNIDDALLFLKKHLNVAFEFESGRPTRIEVWEIPYVALKEAVVNAVAHRDYVDPGTHIQVEVFDDRVSITNFGGLKGDFSIDDLGKRSYHRNPNIVNLLHRADYIEKMGTGILRINKELEKADLPKAEFDVNEHWFTIIFKRKKAISSTSSPDETFLSEQDKKVLGFCLKPKKREEVLSHIGFVNQTNNYKRHIEPLVNKNYLQLTIPDKPKSGNQSYVTTELGRQLIKSK
jgi:ATP-dependent DNA helicase RecG